MERFEYPSYPCFSLSIHQSIYCLLPLFLHKSLHLFVHLFLSSFTSCRWSALSWAATRGHGRVVRLLLQHSADPTRMNTHGQRPADIALAAGFPQVRTELVITLSIVFIIILILLPNLMGPRPQNKSSYRGWSICAYFLLCFHASLHQRVRR